MQRSSCAQCVISRVLFCLVYRVETFCWIAHGNHHHTPPRILLLRQPSLPLRLELLFWVLAVPDLLSRVVFSCLFFCLAPLDPHATTLQVHFYSPRSQECSQLSPTMEKLSEALQGVAKVGAGSEISGGTELGFVCWLKATISWYFVSVAADTAVAAVDNGGRGAALYGFDFCFLRRKCMVCVQIRVP